jgi:hypothetical protein
MTAPFADAAARSVHWLRRQPAGWKDMRWESPRGMMSIDSESLFRIRPSIGAENPIPEEMDHREIAVRVPVMNEVQFLFPSEPCKPLQPRSLYVVFLVEKDVRVE